MSEIPNMVRLAIKKAALIAVPPGSGPGSIGRVVERIKTGQLEADMRLAVAWAKQAVAVVRTGAEPNPWKNATDEEIAGEILRLVGEREKAQAKENQEKEKRI